MQFSRSDVDGKGAFEITSIVGTGKPARATQRNYEGTIEFKEGDQVDAAGTTY